jgi:hypothetical protein
MDPQRWSLRAAKSPLPISGSVAREQRRHPIASFLAAMMIVGTWATGCGSFFGGPEPSGLGTNPIRNGCSWATVQDDCLSTEYCDAADCASMGTCVQRPPPLGSGDLNWVCGCDGITYWNQTFAKAQGVTPTNGACGAAGNGGVLKPSDPLTCSASKQCPRGSICLAGATCQAKQSTCWAWPNDYACPVGALLGYKLCDGTGGCLTECGAITSTKAYSMSTINCR